MVVYPNEVVDTPHGKRLGVLMCVSRSGITSRVPWDMRLAAAEAEAWDGRQQWADNARAVGTSAGAPAASAGVPAAPAGVSSVLAASASAGVPGAPAVPACQGEVCKEEPEGLPSRFLHCMIEPLPERLQQMTPLEMVMDALSPSSGAPVCKEEVCQEDPEVHWGERMIREHFPEYARQRTSRMACEPQSTAIRASAAAAGPSLVVTSRRDSTWSTTAIEEGKKVGKRKKVSKKRETQARRQRRHLSGCHLDSEGSLCSGDFEALSPSTGAPASQEEVRKEEPAIASAGVPAASAKQAGKAETRCPRRSKKEDKKVGKRKKVSKKEQRETQARRQRRYLSGCYLDSEESLCSSDGGYPDEDSLS